MNSVSRGIRNAFRNGIRTLSIVVILGLSIGLSLTMLVAHAAVKDKIADVKSSVGNTISVSAAGVMGFQGGGNPLNETAVNKLSSLAHVSSVTKLVNDQLRNTDSTNREGTTTTANTSLVSAVDAGSLGRRFNGGDASGQGTTGFGGFGGGFTFTPPVSAYGSTDTTKLNGTALTLKSGSTIDGSADKDVALVGTTLASKNHLQVGSTFTAYNSTITVAGIYDTGTTFGNNSVLFSLPTLQRLSSQTNQLTSAVVTVDSISNMDSVTTAVKSTLGSSADVTNSNDMAANAVAPLDSVMSITLSSLIGALVAGAVIILLVMVMVVRERKREIGVIKAIGGSNVRIMGEFMVESLTLAVLGAFVGLLIGIVGAQPVTRQLVNNSTSSNSGQFGQGPASVRVSSSSMGTGQARTFGGFGRAIRQNSAVRGISNVKTKVGWSILLDCFGAAIVIALIGSALSAGLIARVRPSEVMRSN